MNRVVFISKLHKAASSGSLAWCPNDCPDCYEVSLPRYTISVAKVQDTEIIDYEIRVTKPGGEIIDQFFADDFNDSLQELIHNTYVMAQNHRIVKQDPMEFMLSSFEQIITDSK